MKKKLLYFFFSLVLITISFLNSSSINNAYAAAAWDCALLSTPRPNSEDFGFPQLSINTFGDHKEDPNSYYLSIHRKGSEVTTYTALVSINPTTLQTTGPFDWQGLPPTDDNLRDGTWEFNIITVDGRTRQCKNNMTIIVDKGWPCTINFEPPGQLKPNQEIKISVDFLSKMAPNGNDPQTIDIDGIEKYKNVAANSIQNFSIGTFATGSYRVRVHSGVNENLHECFSTLKVDREGGGFGCDDEGSRCSENEKCEADPSTPGKKICVDKEPYDAGQGLLACEEEIQYVANGVTAGTGVFICRTAIGTVRTDAQGFMKTVLSLILGLAGGILIIVIIINGYKFMFSQGDPEKIKDAREGIIAAVMGIFLIIFSLTLLTIVTSNILQIPGFGS